jgi:hypothetical protein
VLVDDLGTVAAEDHERATTVAALGAMRLAKERERGGADGLLRNHNALGGPLSV